MEALTHLPEREADNLEVAFSAIMEQKAALTASLMDAKEKRLARKRQIAHRHEATMPTADYWREQFETLLASVPEDYTVIVGYWRLSGGKQQDGVGAEVQQKASVAWAIAQTDEKRIDLWVWDVDSGREESRVGFDFIREIMATGRVRCVIAYRHDRLARNQYFAELVHREAKQHGVLLVSATETLPKGFLGDMVRQILQAFAQYEGAVIAERLGRGRKRRAQKDGIYLGGEAPYGYYHINVVQERGPSGKLVVCEPEAAIVRVIFALRQRGYVADRIAIWLNEQSIPTRYHSSRGWKQNQIAGILKSEAAYRGEALFNPKAGEAEKIGHDPILPYREHAADRTYLADHPPPKLPHGTRIPPNPYDEPLPPKRARFTTRLTRQQALVMREVYKLVDEGASCYSVAQRLKEAGAVTLRGTTCWNPSIIIYYKAIREDCEQQFLALGLTDSESLDTSVLRADAEGQANLEAHAVPNIRHLRAEGRTLKQIAAWLEEHGYRTRLGCHWTDVQVLRVVNGTHAAVKRWDALSRTLGETTPA